MILKSLYYSDNFFLLISFSIRRIDHRRFVPSLFSFNDFCKFLREFWWQKQLIYEIFSSLGFWNL